MGQADVVRILKRARKPLSAREISERLDISIGAVMNNLRRIRKTENIVVNKATYMNGRPYSLRVYSWEDEG